MSELRYPNESKAYRDAREALLKDEQELARQGEGRGGKAPRAAARRRN